MRVSPQYVPAESLVKPVPRPACALIMALVTPSMAPVSVTLDGPAKTVLSVRGNVYSRFCTVAFINFSFTKEQIKCMLLFTPRVLVDQWETAEEKTFLKAVTGVALTLIIFLTLSIYHSHSIICKFNEGTQHPNVCLVFTVATFDILSCIYILLDLYVSRWIE